MKKVWQIKVQIEQEEQQKKEQRIKIGFSKPVCLGICVPLKLN